jgi:hypothetical protein
MPPFLVIDHDGPTRATREALRLRELGSAVTGKSLNGAASCDALVADACMLDEANMSRIRELAVASPSAQLIAISREGAIASIERAPDFGALAGRLAAR